MRIEPKDFTRDEFLAQYAGGSQWPVVRTMTLLGGKWKPPILYLVAMDINWFGELHRMLPGISRTVLTYELRELEHDGLLSRTIFAEVPPRVEYALTDFGQTCLPILKAMCAWGQQAADPKATVQIRSKS